MVNYHEPLDDGDIPISSSYVPDVGFIGVQGSSNINTDGSSKRSSPVNLNLKQVGDVLFALGQALKAGSIPVVLPSDQVVSTLDTNSAAIKADLDTIVTNTGHIPSAPALEAGNLATAVTRLTSILSALQGTLGVAGTVSVNDFPSIQRVDAIAGDFPSGSIVDLATLAGIVSGGKGAIKAGVNDITDLATLAGIVSGGKGAIKSGAGDLVDLATLLALAGASGDANSVNSFMGRLTKIRDLLNATLNVAVTNGNANGQATMVNSAPVVLPSDQSAIASKAAASAYVDGSNVTLGTKADTASTDATTTNSQMSFTKGFVKILADIWDSTNHLFHLNVKQWNGAVPSTTNAVITNTQIQALIANGQGFRVCTADVVTGAANAFVGLQMLANAVGKTIVVYNIYTVTNGNAADQRIYQQANTTADTTLTTDLTATPGITNQQPGNVTASVVTSIKGSPASTTQTTGFVGTQSMQAGATANAMLNMLQNGSQIYLKNGVAAGFSVYVKVPTSANLAGITVEWVEF